MCLRSSRTAAGSVVPQGGNVNHCQSQIWRLNWVGPLCITANLCLIFPKVLHSHLHDIVSLTPFHQEKSHRLWSSLAPWSYLDTSPVRAKHLLLYVSYVASVLGEWLPQPSSQKLHSSGTPPPDWYIHSVAIMGSPSTLPQEAGCFRRKTILSPFDCSFDVFPGHGRYTLPCLP